MAVSQKCQYALRAVFELARQYDRGPLKIGEVAAAQGIPLRFLEVILNELKQGGFVESRRGKEGGYFLIRHPDQLTVGDIIRFVQGPIAPVDANSAQQGPPRVFAALWEQAGKALSAVYDGATFGRLVEDERRLGQGNSPDFMI